MGLFLAISGVIGKKAEEVTKALEEYISFKKGNIEEVQPVNEAFDLCVIGENEKNTTIVYPNDFFRWEEASEYLSKVLNTSVCSFHIHDSDLWMYSFYNCGNVEDKFNPIPDYWERLSEKEIEKWKGNPEVICKFIKDISSDDIKNYYKFWRRDNVQAEKAYEEDEFAFGDEWQVVDFMNKLSIIYPFEEDNGFPIGKTYKISLRYEF
ncbi:hypothetical protein HBE96_07060 [Clostridium sp. P21]|uniref:Uncharacterized protein n=1 Tax=Clostridium muellerianum TaxID=2716538 RepID=A0A7Y0EFG4_9CLOT|nr:hypothetical protein [Clostridium muellerianum]NMM62452.1 hypothetical protein [Clostridium muellerianum]